jgi:hypothetical protein
MTWLEIDPVWMLPALIFLLLGLATVMAWRSHYRGELPEIEPDNSIVHGRGDWSRPDDEIR